MSVWPIRPNWPSPCGLHDRVSHTFVCLTWFGTRLCRIDNEFFVSRHSLFFETEDTHLVIFRCQHNTSIPNPKFHIQNKLINAVVPNPNTKLIRSVRQLALTPRNDPNQGTDRLPSKKQQPQQYHTSNSYYDTKQID